MNQRPQPRSLGGSPSVRRPSAPTARRRCAFGLLGALLWLAPPAAEAGTSSADLSISKTDGATTSVPGTEIVYTIVASNAGPDAVTGATVTDTFPASLACTWSCTASAGSSCPTAGLGDLAEPVDLLSGGTATFTATCLTDPAATGSLVNTATVTNPIAEANPGDESATDTNTWVPAADLEVLAILTTDPVVAGEPFTILVAALNNGPSDAADATVTSTLPVGSTFSSTAGCAEDPTGVPTCSLGALASGGSADFVIEAIAPPADGTVTVAVGGSTPDPDPDNDELSVPVVVFGGNPLEIPTLDVVGLALLLLLLVACALPRLRRS